MSPRPPALRPGEVIRALERAGFFLHHTTGSHHYFKHPDKPGRLVTVPVHPGDLKRGKNLCSAVATAHPRRPPIGD
jgi:predicted RNA binding protein YcfA (HicA-like mRNA interferase family)